MVDAKLCYAGDFDFGKLILGKEVGFEKINGDVDHLLRLYKMWEERVS